ncbi:unnamed protein product (mitochondrion) [Plasmodiophora brassicae]|uniref:FYVE-type domain-containing protein n=1 Tax=Plasmodiophora brassicae TaxID=37360 RepID=A0A3P3YC35_PLABS|nr:unnamed protein product [Plasmodiophora brassicae]
MGQTINRSVICWEEDGPVCSLCRASFAPLFRRRHHCRSCGLLVCNDCSPYTSYLPQVGWGDDDPQRVCQVCARKSLTVAEVETHAYRVWSCTDPRRPRLDHLERLAPVVRAAKACPTFNAELLRLMTTTLSSVFARVHHRVQADVHWATRSTLVDDATLLDCIDSAERLRVVYDTVADDLAADVRFESLDSATTTLRYRVARRTAPLPIPQRRSLQSTAPIVRVRVPVVPVAGERRRKHAALRPHVDDAIGKTRRQGRSTGSRVLTVGGR